MFRQFWGSTYLVRSTCSAKLRLGKNQNSILKSSCFVTPLALPSFEKSFVFLADAFVRRMSGSEATHATHKFTNRLVQEKSPYLLQHAHNPVDWYPWGEEAIEKARQEDKLIFLSVGYSTCHWCHVMERESFEDETVAAIMNEHFVNIKVDREERPDIDRIYMQFVLMINGHGGWPMSVWLTPELAPITAGTYFPPHDRWGTPSFTTVLNTINKKWRENKHAIKTTGAHVITALQSAIQKDSSSETGSTQSKLQKSLLIFKRRFDDEHGGFGSHPKFPEVSRLNFLFHASNVTQDEAIISMPIKTLKHIGKGGIHDHVFGGFARYSVDRQWHVPHFEKMLYDQGQLMTAFANAYKMTQKVKFVQLADGIYNYLMKDLHHPMGGFYSGEDADSLPKIEDTLKVEGAFYAWTYAEVEECIAKHGAQIQGFDTAKAFEIYAHHYDLKLEGNVAPASDPHGHLVGKNILIVRGSEEETCQKFEISHEALSSLLNSVNNILHTERDKRPRPHLDIKIICSWNGLVLSGLANLANCYTSKRKEYLETAAQLVKFIRQNLYDSEHGVLLRSCYGISTDNDSLETVTGERVEGFLDDYAFLIKGLLTYYTASLDNEALEWAKLLQQKQDELFWDGASGGYFYSKANMANIVVRLKEDHDGAEPCGNSIAAQNLLHLSYIYEDEAYKQKAQQLFSYFSGEESFGYTLPEMMSAMLLDEQGIDFIAVVGSDSEIVQQFLQICRKAYSPGMALIHLDPLLPLSENTQRMLGKFKMLDATTTVYICHNKVCRLPITDPVKLEQELGSFPYKNI